MRKEKTLEEFESSLRTLKNLRAELKDLKSSDDSSVQVNLSTFDDSLTELEKIQRNLRSSGLSG